MEADARPLVPQLLVLLDSVHDSFSAAQALKKISLNAEERAQISQKLERAKRASDSNLVYCLNQLLN